MMSLPLTLTALLWCAALLAQPARAQAPAQPQAASPAPAAAREGQRVDDRRRDQPVTVDLWGQPVELTGSWDISDERRKDFDLDSNRARDRRVREHEVKLEARLRPGARTEVFLQAVGLQESRNTQGTAGTQRKKALERGQAWVRLERLFDTPWTLQLGRVALTERRAWWWDDDLDALRLQLRGDASRADAWRLDTGLARTVARVSSADRGVLPTERGRMRWWGQASWPYARRHSVEAFWLLASDRSGTPALGSLFVDEDASDVQARWLGLRASGEFRPEGGPRLAYWADTAQLRGRESLVSFTELDDGSLRARRVSERRLRSWAVDLGATLVMDRWPLRPSLSVAWAQGSGGAVGNGLDPNFRQTGLQENKVRLAGVKRLRRYGELLRPELSNLSVGTLGAGVRVLENSSLELVAHRYRQPFASTTLAGSRLSTDPLGLSPDLGQEIDLLLAVREWRQWEFTLALSAFKPGAAFAPNRRSTAYGVEAGAALNF